MQPFIIRQPAELLQSKLTEQQAIPECNFSHIQCDFLGHALKLPDNNCFLVMKLVKNFTVEYTAIPPALQADAP